MSFIPSHKIISLGNGKILLVDGFNYSSKAPEGTKFFLTHAHSDHYTGIRADWNLGLIYCSETTAALISHILGVEPSVLHPLPLNTPTTLPDGLVVTLIDANHCPGAVIFLFLLPDGRRIVHTGDFRFSAEHMLCCPHLAKFKGADEVYLDTTYANPKYVFPPQEESIEYVAKAIHRLLQEDATAFQPSPAADDTHVPSNNELLSPQVASSQHKDQPRRRRLFLISTYVIGKERILQAVSQQCGIKIHISDRKARVMSCLPGLPEDMFTSDSQETPVHVVPWGFLGEAWPFFRPNWKIPSQYSQDQGASSYIGFVPTGWVHGMAKYPFPVISKGVNTVHLVPYSEHSSFEELISFVEYLKPVKVVPTVFSSKDDKAVDKLLKRFRLVIDQDAAKAKFIATIAGNGVKENAGGKKSVGGAGGIGKSAAAAGGKGKKLDTAEGEEGDKEEDMPVEGGASGDDNNGNGNDGNDDTERELEIVELLDESEEEEEENEDEEAAVAAAESDWQVLLGLTEGKITELQAHQLLKTANGDISRAANMYFEGNWNKNKRPSPSGGGGSTAATTAGGASPSAAGASKRRRTSAGGGSNVPEKGVGGQRSILSFFGGSSSKPAAATAAPMAVVPSPSPPSPIAVKEPELERQQQTTLLPPLPETQTKQQPTNIASIFQRPLPHSSSKITTAGAGASSILTTATRDAVALPLAQYHPILHAPWHQGQPTPYLHLARAFEAMDATTKRLAISDILTNTFRSVLALTPEDLPSIAYLSVGKIAPDYEQGMELSVGGSTVAAAVSEATGVTRNRLREMYNELGDLGDVAAACKRTQATLARPAPLTVTGVHATLRGIAAERGAGAARRRQGAILLLLRSCREAETKYLVRTLVQALRVGANWRSVVPAIAKAVVIHGAQAEALDEYIKKETSPSTSAAATIEQPPLPPIPPKSELDAASTASIAAFHVCPNLDLLIEAMHAGPMNTLEERCRLTPGVPIKPMLAKISQGIADAIAQLKGAPFVAEYKYDGVRAQIHLSAAVSTNDGTDIGDGTADGTNGIAIYKSTTDSTINRVMVFSRNCEDRTMSFPDVAQQVIEAAEGGAKSCILDAEVVAVERNNNMNVNNSDKIAENTIDDNHIEKGDNNNGITKNNIQHYTSGLRLRPFQDLASRPRGPIDISTLTVDVCVFVFDILERDGESLLGLTLRERRKILLEALPGLRDGYVQLAQGVEVLDQSSEDVVERGEGREERRVNKGGVDDAFEGEIINLVVEKEAPAAPSPVAAEQEVLAAATPPAQEEETTLVDKVETWLLEATAAGTEGLMLKSLDAAYQPSRRSESWIKLKKDYCLGLHESLDLVVMGAWYGSGRKAGWYSPFLLGVFDPETEEIQSLCRVMSGFSDEFYKAATARLKETIIPTKKSYYVTNESPDVWFQATEVWEIRGADLTLSPVHKAAVGKVAGSDRGVGLRFPRFLRIRDDKSVEDATTADTIAAMYSAQERKV